MKAFTKHKTLIVFGVSFILLLAYLLIEDNQIYPGDSGDYFNMGQEFVRNGVFSLSHYPSTFRGCLFPLLLYLFSSMGQMIFGNEFIGYMILASLTAAAVSACLPVLFRPFVHPYGLPAGKAYSVLKILFPFLPAFLILAFWDGLILYPLSDLFSFSALLFSLCICFRLLFPEKPRKKRFIFLLSALSGACLYFSYNTRTIYLFAMIFLGLLSLFLILKVKRSVGFSAAFIAGVLVGVFALGSVQGFVNSRGGVFSLRAGTEIQYPSGQGGGLFEYQLFQGIQMSQYETFLGEPEEYPVPGVVFQDYAGRQISAKESLGGTLTVDQCLRLVMRYPFDFLGIYTRHFINMLNPVFGGVYMKDLSGKIALSFVNYCILFLTCAQMILGKESARVSPLKKSWRSRWSNFGNEKTAAAGLLIAALTPCLFILPGAVEVRFFFPFYMLLYGYFTCCADIPLLLSKFRKRPFLTITVFVLAFSFLLSSWGSTYANNVAGVFISVN